MSFDKDTRNLLAKTVAACRRRLIEDITDQLRGVFGLHPDGTVLPLDKLTHLSPDQHAAARRLRDLLDHYTAGAAGKDSDRRKAAYERMVLEIAFTVLNRLAALRLCEERGLVVECVRKGTTSAGFQMFERIAGGALGGRYDTYRVFLECFFDELALDLGVLFDRMTPQSAVFPSERCLEDILAELNKAELTPLWTEDETIGWVYQYFNPPEERKAMREASQAPRNSRELAVRNQFFTPRYVVEFLTDNTLGRIWYEMRKGETVLKEECRYLVRRPNEIFLASGEKAPAEPEHEADLSQEELLKEPVYIEHRPRKDPRDLRVLDPACGSGHFLLYAFDLLERIYEEAWRDPESPKSEVTGRALSEDFESLDDLRREVPKLIVEHNLHGIDIDPRAVQIAALALWLRAQKTWKNLRLKAPDRPGIARSNIVTAEPMPGEEDMRREFTAGLKPRVLGQIVDEVFEKMKLAGEAGSLLKIEEEIKDAVAAAGKQWREYPKPEQQLLFPTMDALRPKQQELRFDVKGITDERFWEQAEDRILDALKDYAEQAENGRAVRRRLFAEDAARGFAFIDLCRKRYDVALMNPPFGPSSPRASAYIEHSFPRSKIDLYASFVDRWLLRINSGWLGAITNRTFVTLSSYERFRDFLTIGSNSLSILADLGSGVLDSAMVETAAYTVARSTTCEDTIFITSFTIPETKALSFTDQSYWTICAPRLFEILPKHPFAYWLPKGLLELYRESEPIEQAVMNARAGLQTSNDFRFARLWWEVFPQKSQWKPFAKGGAYSPFWDDIHLVVNWFDDGKEMRAFHRHQLGYSESRLIRSEEDYFKPGLNYPWRTSSGFAPRVLPSGCIFAAQGSAILPKSYSGSWQEVALLVLASLNSTLFGALMSIGVGAVEGAARSYQVGQVQRLPWPKALYSASLARNRLAELAKSAYEGRRSIDAFDETTRSYCAFCYRDADWKKLVLAKIAEKRAQIDVLLCEVVGVRLEELSHSIAIGEASETAAVDEKETDITGERYDSAETESEYNEGWISLGLGIIFGRWDIRIALAPSLAPKLPDPFDPLPVCPPGMLVGLDGLPAEPNCIVSEEWLRARPDANTLPPEGAVKNPTIPDDSYPLRVSWDGVLVDDPGFNGDRPHRDDIIRRVREVFDLLWKDKAHEIEQEACDILGVSDLREYFRKSSGFFQDHLKRYSKSRRKAPIYWPLSTASGSYTIWLYYHRLTDQTLYAAVNKYLEPKIAETERGIARIEDDLKAIAGRAATQLTDRLNEARAFLGELRDLREELLRIAALPYKPDLNDGVIINAAPFHGLFRLRSWAKDTEDCWKTLAKGDYDWAHLAYTIWPDRVREVCKSDRSIAIAHGLEDLCEVEAPETRKKGGRGGRKSGGA